MTGEVVFCYVMCYAIIIWLKKENVEDFDAAKFVYIIHLHGDECFSHTLQKSSLIDYLDIVYFETETIFRSLVENGEIIFKSDPEISLAKE